MVCACPRGAEQPPRSGAWSRYKSGKEVLHISDELFLAVWFSGPIRNKSPGFSSGSGRPLPPVGRAVAELLTCGRALLLPGLWDVSCGDLELGGRLSQEDAAEETEADDNRSKSQPSLPRSSPGCRQLPRTAATQTLSLPTGLNALYVKLPGIKINCALSQKHKAEAVSSQLTINT